MLHFFRNRGLLRTFDLRTNSTTRVIVDRRFAASCVSSGLRIPFHLPNKDSSNDDTPRFKVMRCRSTTCFRARAAG